MWGFCPPPCSASTSRRSGRARMTPTPRSGPARRRPTPPRRSGRRSPPRRQGQGDRRPHGLRRPAGALHALVGAAVGRKPRQGRQGLPARRRPRPGRSAQPVAALPRRSERQAVHGRHDRRRRAGAGDEAGSGRARRRAGLFRQDHRRPRRRAGPRHRRHAGPQQPADPAQSTSKRSTNGRWANS